MQIFRTGLLMGLTCFSPLVCLSSGIYKVEDEKGHITYTNMPSVIDQRKDTKKLNDVAPINIIAPRSPVASRFANLTTASRHENDGPGGPAGLQKGDLDRHQIANSQPATRARRLGDSLRTSSDTSVMPTYRAAREKFAHDQPDIDDYSIQVFDLKIKSH